MENLRQELVETQKTRTELIKWKLILVSALGAAGLGFTKTEAIINARLLLCCIPFVCAYVDMQYANLALRIMGIATFLRKLPSLENHASAHLKQYEDFLMNVRKGTKEHFGFIGGQSLQSLVVRGSSLVFSGLIAIYGGYGVIINRSSEWWPSVSMLLSGSGGVLFTVWLFFHYRARRDIIEEEGEKIESSTSSG